MFLVAHTYEQCEFAATLFISSACLLVRLHGNCFVTYAAMSGVNQLRPGSSPMYVGPAAHFSQASTSAMTVPPPSYMLPQRHQPSPQPTSAPPRSHDEKEQKNNALLILKMLCETPLLQAYLLDLLKARSAVEFDLLYYTFIKRVFSRSCEFCHILVFKVLPYILD